MTTEEAAKVYQTLFTAFPMARDWLAKVEDPKATYGIWCGVISGCEYADAIAAVDAIVSGDEEPPEAYERERWPQVIRRAANQRRSERKAKERMNRYHVAATEAKTVDQKFIIAMRESKRIGELVRDGKLDRLENDAMVDDLVNWSERKGQVPDWME